MSCERATPKVDDLRTKNLHEGLSSFEVADCVAWSCGHGGWMEGFIPKERLGRSLRGGEWLVEAAEEVRGSGEKWEGKAEARMRLVGQTNHAQWLPVKHLVT